MINLRLKIKSKSPYLIHLAVILFFLAIAIFYTWPLVLSFNDHTTAIIKPDRDQNFWFMWWVKRALLDFHTTPYFTPMLFYPGGTDLAIYPTNLTGSILSLPVQLLWGIVPTFNFLYFVGLVGGAWGAYCLITYLTDNRRAGLLAGLVYAFSPWQAPATYFGQLTIIQLQWLPFYTLWLLKFLKQLAPADPADLKLVSLRYKIRYGTLSASFLVLIAFTDQYHLLFATFITVFLASWHLLRILFQKRWYNALGVALGVGLAVLPAVLSYAPLFIRTSHQTTSGVFTQTSNEIIPGADLGSILAPWQSLWQLQPFEPKFLLHTLVWLAVMALGLIGVIRQRGIRVWGLMFVVLVILSLGTTLVFFGSDTGIPMSGELISKIPMLNSVHYLWRWLIPASLVIAVCSGYGWVWFETRLKTFKLAQSLKLKGSFRGWLENSGVAKLTSGIFLLVFVLGSSPQPIEWSDWVVEPTPAIFTSGQMEQPGALLELPFDMRYHHKAAYMRFQIEHGRPILSGYLARTPVYFNERSEIPPYEKPTPFFDYAASPLAFIMQAESLKLSASDAINLTSDRLRSYLTYNHFAYLVLYKYDYGEKLSDAVYNQQLKIIERVVGSTKNGCMYEDTQMLVCAVPPPAQMQPLLTFSRGWYGAETDGGGQRWMNGQEGFLAAFVPQTGRYVLSFDAIAFARDRSLTLEVDGKAVTTLKTNPAQQSFTVTLELSTGDHLIRLFSPEPADRPIKLGISQDNRPLSLLFRKMQLDFAS
ncbi:MAG: hypothetical protein HXX08_11625 [Chloroflexi bacterium]|uniref:YfhO family protein n=1 Tax=Candidatus Chlorohelix allophototropha TaxID=3003348 RepID=A0A8T7M2B0_9CHLR|nr:hypothetical protein [Chloroflexota bacterium]WJW65888.1 hypothetical protein OZ401_001668 [Chloroflexota bacterium L227-S17]